jgi:uncharacterized protein YbjT (DUF2867 family)
MKVILFGATGMVGQAALRECLADPDVECVLAVGRRPVGQQHPKLRELVRADLFDWTGAESGLGGYDACMFCIGVSSVGMTEEAYRHVTYDLTMAAAKVIAQRNSNLTFLYVTGSGTDGTERGRSMWARVKGQTENALLALPFKGAFMFRPGVIIPMHGIKSKTALYQAAYMAMSPFFSVVKALFPRSVTTSEQLGRAMLRVAKQGAPKRILETPDIVQLGN